MSAPGTWPPRDVWTRLWEDWYVLEIAETPLSVRSLSKRRRGRAAWPRKAARARDAASEPGHRQRRGCWAPGTSSLKGENGPLRKPLPSSH